MLRRLIMAVCLVLAAPHPAAALDQVSMQLKWKHQFQFAGYYAALEQGFYRDAGLDVTIREGGPDINVAQTVASGKADFGACNASVLREWTLGRCVAAVARARDISGRTDPWRETGARRPYLHVIFMSVHITSVWRFQHRSNPITCSLLPTRCDLADRSLASKQVY
jgi:NMT1/THI5 like